MWRHGLRECAILDGVNRRRLVLVVAVAVILGACVGAGTTSTTAEVIDARTNREARDPMSTPPQATTATSTTATTTTVPPPALILRIEYHSGWTDEFQWLEFMSDGSYIGELDDFETGESFATTGTVPTELARTLVDEMSRTDMPAWLGSLPRGACNALHDGNDWFISLTEADGATRDVSTCSRVFDGTSPIANAVFDLVAATPIYGDAVADLWENHHPRLGAETYAGHWIFFDTLDVEARANSIHAIRDQLAAIPGVAAVRYHLPSEAIEVARELFATDTDALERAESLADSENPPGLFLLILRGAGHSENVADVIDGIENDIGG